MCIITTIRYGGGGTVGSSAGTWCFPMNNVAGGCGSSIWEYDFLEDPYIELTNTRSSGRETLRKLFSVFGG